MLIVLSILSLLITATPKASELEVSLNELLTHSQNYQNDFLTTQGNIVEESVTWNADKVELQFDVVDEQGHTLHVIHHGVRPDNFSQGVIAILEGNLTADKQFVAERVKTRCPSKYESQDQANYDINTHQIKK